MRAFDGCAMDKQRVVTYLVLSICGKNVFSTFGSLAKLTDLMLCIAQLSANSRNAYAISPRRTAFG